jgi:YfiR/HmsC-like
LKTQHLNNLGFFQVLAMLIAFSGAVFGVEKIEMTPAEFKAVILSKLVLYVDWPARSGSPTSSPFVIGLYGDVDFREVLEGLVKDKQVDGRPLLVKPLESLTNVSSCNVLFIPEGRLGEWDKLRQTLDMKGVMTVGDAERFPANSGIICNLESKGRVLEISLRSAKEAGLHVNPQLLHVAKVVK